ncbi:MULTISPECIES: peptidylprolyl isomerase [unclassified Thioalkalivibrio]|uniref:peptidylprolyl isomerase n=1 Tax=unclassified Thioalkalivibrio TaxID=2621013 RepID=UPI00036E5885|nr:MULTISPECIES: peptidylprolyl isomerase [unclassified Thioalkalivibrio]
MKRTALFVAVSLLVLPVGASATGTDDADPVASGPGVVIERSDLANELRIIPEDQRRELLENPEVGRDLIHQMYFRGRMAVLAEELGYADEEIVQAQIKRLKERFYREIVPRRFVEQIELPDFSDAAREYYDANLDDFMVEEERRASHILLRAPDDERKERRREEAEELLAKLRDGADFAEVAQEHGEDGTRQIGGDLGYFKRGRMVEEFDEVVFGMEPGDVELLETRFGFHLVYLRDVEGGEPRAFEEVEERIKDRLRAEYVEEELTSYLTSVGSPRDAEIDDEAIVAVIESMREELEDQEPDVADELMVPEQP